VVGPCGLEPQTWPRSRPALVTSRHDERPDHPCRFPAFDFQFSSPSFRERNECLAVNEFPRPTTPSGKRVAAFVFGKAPLQVIGRPDIEFTGSLALQDVDDAHNRKEW